MIRLAFILLLSMLIALSDSCEARLLHGIGGALPAPPPSGLVGEWALGVGSVSGTTVADASGNGNTGTVVGGPLSFITTPQGALFDGSTQSVDIPLTVNFPAITVSAWIEQKLLGGSQRVVANALSTLTNTGFELEFGPSSGFFNIGTAAGVGAAAWTQPTTQGSWYHYVGVYDGTTVLAYFNGVLIASSAFVGGSIAPSATHVAIARNSAYSGVDFFNGWISDVRIYNTALTGAQVLALYNAGVPGDTTTPLPVIYGNTGGTLHTRYGTWDFGDQYALGGFSTPDMQAYHYPRLNGREILNITGIEGNMLVCRQLIVANGGNVYCAGQSQIFTVWDNYSWLYDATYPNGSTSLDPLPAQVTPPFTPSADGTILTGGTGSLTSIDGVWSFGAVNGSGWNLMLNGIPVGLSGGTFACDMIEINSHGQVWARTAGTSSWNLWLEQVLTSSAAPTALPIPIGIKMTPSFVDPFSGTSPVGTFITTITITMSDSSSFTGTWTIDGNFFGHVYAAMSGTTLQTTVSPVPDYMTGESESIGVHATQNGFTIYKLFVVGVH